MFGRRTLAAAWACVVVLACAARAQADSPPGPVVPAAGASAEQSATIAQATVTAGELLPPSADQPVSAELTAATVYESETGAVADAALIPAPSIERLPPVEAALARGIACEYLAITDERLVPPPQIGDDQLPQSSLFDPAGPGGLIVASALK